MAEEKNSKIEREYVIPLRAKCRVVPRYKKANKAIKTIKEFLAKHMKIKDRDLNKIKLDLSVNEAVWARGIRKPVHKIKVRAVKEGDIVRVTLVELSKKAQDKKKRLEKRETLSKESVKKKEAEPKKEESEDKNKDGVKDSVEEKEKKISVKESQEKMEKTKAKTLKKTTKKENENELKTVRDNKFAK
jgi:large subunit ribosomal protein L31e